MLLALAPIRREKKALMLMAFILLIQSAPDHGTLWSTVLSLPSKLALYGNALIYTLRDVFPWWF